VRFLDAVLAWLITLVVVGVPAYVVGSLVGAESGGAFYTVAGVVAIPVFGVAWLVLHYVREDW
jgi:hypothetical protein